jgi:hypothetical protein
MFNLFKKNRKEVKTYWLVDDNSSMPVACSTYEQAVAFVNDYYAYEDNRLDRIYEITK